MRMVSGAEKRPDAGEEAVRLRCVAGGDRDQPVRAVGVVGRPSTVSSPPAQPRDHVTAVPCRCSNRPRRADWRSTGGCIRPASPECIRRLPRLSAGALGTVDDTPGRRGALQQPVQQRGPDEPVPGRTTAHAASLWPARTAQPRTIANLANVTGGQGVAGSNPVSPTVKPQSEAGRP